MEARAVAVSRAAKEVLPSCENARPTLPRVPPRDLGYDPEIEADVQAWLDALAPKVTTLSSDIYLYHYAPYRGEKPGSPEFQKAHLEGIERLASQGLNPNSKNLQSWGDGYYLATDPTSTWAYGGADFALTELKLKKGARLLDQKDVPQGIRSSCDFQSLLFGRMCRRVGTEVFKRLKIDGLPYRYGTDNCWGRNDFPLTAVVLLRTGNVDRHSVRLYTRQHNPAPGYWTGEWRIRQYSRGLLIPESQKGRSLFKNWPGGGITLPWNRSWMKRWDQKHHLGCREHEDRAQGVPRPAADPAVVRVSPGKESELEKEFGQSVFSPGVYFQGVLAARKFLAAEGYDYSKLTEDELAMLALLARIPPLKGVSVNRVRLADSAAGKAAYQGLAEKLGVCAGRMRTRVQLWSYWVNDLIPLPDAPVQVDALASSARISAEEIEILGAVGIPFPGVGEQGSTRVLLPLGAKFIVQERAADQGTGKRRVLEAQ